MVVPLMQWLQQRLGRGKDGFIVRKCCGDRSRRFRTPLGRNIRSELRRVALLSHWLLVTLIFGDRLSRQQDGLVSGRRARRPRRLNFSRARMAGLLLSLRAAVVSATLAAVSAAATATPTPSPASIAGLGIVAFSRFRGFARRCVCMSFQLIAFDRSLLAGLRQSRLAPSFFGASGGSRR